MIRPLTPDELDAYLDLVQTAFTVTFTNDQYRDRSVKFKREQVWGYYVESNLAAVLTVLPLQVYIEGRPFPMGGIAQVANYPEYRRQGMVGRLLEHALLVMKEAGQTVSLLNPFLSSFYRKYGWDYFSEMQVCCMETAALPKLPEAGGRVRRVYTGEKADTDGLQAMLEVYDAYAKRYNGILIRDESWVRHHLLKRTPGTIALYESAYGNGPRGYMLYSFKDKWMQIHELVTLDEEAERGLWQFIRHHDSTIHGVEFKAPADSPLFFRFPDQTGERTVRTNFMFRIVDAERFLREYPWKASGKAEQFVFHISDRYAPWNEGIFQVQLSAEEKAHVIRIQPNAPAGSTAGPDSDSESLHCDIQTLSTILIGCQSPTRMYELGRLQGRPETVDRLNEARSSRLPYIMDLF
ncbi:GNAT family N-acetyltransferase [Paenibacillus koleovorans]|uniref:GNAT family N-acetyltransferase n=1 Tax=Paenibacillus koleovorans TaxID=121608 RepID=UPI000FD7468C|nr:GNAT family N-acetyltransferase [Paenibacillus koleovorans]